MNSLETVGLPTTAILGVGSMGGAVLNGILSSGISLDSPIRVTVSSNASKEKFLSNDQVIAHSLESDTDANLKAVRGADVVILGVKPHMIPALIQEIADSVKPDATIISIAAGVTITAMKSHLPETVQVIRAMPNTPVLVGRGVTGVVALPGAKGESLDVARRLFSTVGKVVTLPAGEETKLDALSAVSGSGPAYVFFFIEKMTAAAIDLGFSQESAKTMVEETFLGASLLLDQEGLDPSVLRKNVTSPNGTTEQAIKRLEGAGLEAIVADAYAAAIRRAGEMAAETR